jgi:hypothetical protein
VARGASRPFKLSFAKFRRVPRGDPPEGGTDKAMQKWLGPPFLKGGTKYFLEPTTKTTQLSYPLDKSILGV